ncbi:GIY-YIG nuclease family protein [Lachnospira multipara]|uniref:GIY-YIG nuclease family protein n=1 Tax=Lachnospira multipara TaxID=28051 RepID=UPI0004863CB1|nr:GIY-YIG nuclease family protein [Lachnospira multipara]
MSNAKVVDVVFYNGTLDGVVKLSNSNGNGAVVISSPRTKIKQLLELSESNNFGVYLLLSDKKVYIGQAKELKRRIKDHEANKDWWKRVIILTTTSNSLDSSDIDYLEAELISLAKMRNVLSVDNIQKGNIYNIKESRRIVLEGFIEEINFILDFIGVSVFSSENISPDAQRTSLVSNRVLQLTQLAPARKYIRENVLKNKKFSYAKRANNNNEYAIDPQEDLLKNTWNIVLNDIVTYCFYVFEIPNSEITDIVIEQFKRRNDDAHKLSIRIDGSSFVDKRSGFDFSKYLKKRISYCD